MARSDHPEAVSDTVPLCQENACPVPGDKRGGGTKNNSKQWFSGDGEKHSDVSSENIPFVCSLFWNTWQLGHTSKRTEISFLIFSPCFAMTSFYSYICLFNVHMNTNESRSVKKLLRQKDCTGESGNTSLLLLTFSSFHNKVKFCGTIKDTVTKWK